jgi:hypothetical protein
MSLLSARLPGAVTCVWKLSCLQPHRTLALQAHPWTFALGCCMYAFAHHAAGFHTQ